MKTKKLICIYDYSRDLYIIESYVINNIHIILVNTSLLL